jgi:predicted metal-dependent hydrolase
MPSVPYAMVSRWRRSCSRIGSQMDTPYQQRDLWGAQQAPADVAMHIRESPRARRLSVRVFRNGRVEVIVPRRTSPRLVEQFLVQHRQWIDAKREVAARHAPPQEPFPPSHIQFALTGAAWRLHLGGGSVRPRLAASTSLLSVRGSPTPDALRTLLRRWLLEAARAALVPLVAPLAETMAVRFNAVHVRRQRTRWGSCSTRGVISLNACLVFQPPEVVRYLLVHELAHTTHMNHSRRFWALVERHEPQWRTLDRQLLDGWRNVPTWVFGQE